MYSLYRTLAVRFSLTMFLALAAAHNGSVTAEPGSAGGLRVTVRLPIA